MDLNWTETIIALGAPPPGTQVNATGEMIKLVLMVGTMFAMLYFISIRPQRKKAQEHAELLKSVKAGDRILTTSGIVGIVISVKEKTLSLRSADSKLEITKSAIVEITERGASSASES